MKWTRYLTTCLLIFCGLHASANFLLPVQEYIEQNPSLQEELFFESFPFAELMQRMDIKRVKEVEQVRQLLEQNGISGDLFIEQLYAYFLGQFPVNLDNPDSTKLVFSIAETLSNSDQYLPDSVWQYMGASMFLLEEIEKEVQAGLDSGRLRKKDRYAMYLIDRLGDNDHHLNLPPSNVEKLIGYAKAGKFGYIWHKMKTTYQKEFIILLIGMLFGFALLYGVYRFWRNRRNKQALNIT